jgi:hypothetical protein
MADQITANPNAARDWAGDIVPGALLYTYATGTTTLLTVYQDVDATIPHPNPIEADSNGVFPQIFFTGIVKGVATDPDGVVLPGFPMDPLPRSVVGTSGASTISFLPTADIPVANVQEAIEQVQANITQSVGETGAGFLAINADGIGVRRTLTGTANQLTITNPQGIAGNPVVAAVVPSQEEAQAGTDATKLMTAQRTAQAITAQIKPAINASGAAPIYACRAWVNFDGTGTVEIRGSGNVSSITDNGAGDYRVNFATAMPDANYAVVTSGHASTGSPAAGRVTEPYNLSTGSVEIVTASSSSGSAADNAIVTVAIFR